MGKRQRFRDMPCIYCGVNPSIPQGDHVFARGFFPVSDRDNLPKVPGCDGCNNEKSKLEHYLATVLPFGSRHKDALDRLSNDVPRKLAQNLKLHRALADGMTTMVTESSTRQAMAVPFEPEKLRELLRYIVRGLLWHHWNLMLPADHDVRVYAVVKKVQPFFDGIIGQNAVKRVTENLGNGVFEYEGAQGTPATLTAWRFKLFGGLTLAGDPRTPEAEITNHYVLSARAALLDKLDENFS